MKIRVLLALGVLLLPGLVFSQGRPPVSGEKGRTPRVPPSPSSPAAPVLSSQEVKKEARIKERLSELGFVVLGGEGGDFRSFYLTKGLERKFLTTDMVWDLYQEYLTLTIYKLEKIQASRLKKFSRRLLSLARGKGGRLWRRIFLLCGPALAFQDPSALDSFSGDEASGVKHVLEDMKKGEPFPVPLFKEWVDPKAFRPAWFYAMDPVLSGYWKALTWYRSLPLLSRGKKPRTMEDEEGKNALLLAKTVLGDGELGRLFRLMDRTWTDLMGPPMGLDPKVLEKAAEKILGEGWNRMDLPTAWEGMRNFLVRSCPGKFPRENDVLGCGFRIFPKRWTPDSLQLCRDCLPSIPDRLLPSGLDWIALGPLASRTGRRLFREEFQGRPWVEPVLSAPAAPLWDSLYCRHFPVLRRILEPCKGAPPVFFSRAWRAKQAWTQLGATAPLRRIFQLHLVDGPSTGIVEERFPPALSPYPGFYKGVGELLEETARFFSGDGDGAVRSTRAGKIGAEKKPGRGSGGFPAALRGLAEDCRKLAELAGKQWPGPGLSREEEDFLEEFPRKWYGRLQRLLPKTIEKIFLGPPAFFLPGWIGPEGTDKTFYFGIRGAQVLLILLPGKGKVLRYVGRVYGYQEGPGPKGLRMGAGPKPPLAYPRFTRLFLVEDV